MRVTPRRIVTLAVTTGIVVGLIATPTRLLEGVELVVSRPWFPIAIIGLYLVRPFLAWPITAISLVVGYRYGILVGIPIALAGAVGTSLIPYAAGRYFRPHTGWFAWIADHSEQFFATTGGLRGIIAARLAPTPAEPVSAAAGLGHVSLGAFVLGTLIGELPWTVTAVVAGHTMHRVSVGAATPDPWLIAGGTLAAVVLLAGPTYRYIRRTHGRVPEERVTG